MPDMNDLETVEDLSNGIWFLVKDFLKEQDLSVIELEKAYDLIVKDLRSTFDRQTVLALSRKN